MRLPSFSCSPSITQSCEFMSVIAAHLTAQVPFTSMAAEIRSLLLPSSSAALSFPLRPIALMMCSVPLRIKSQKVPSDRGSSSFAWLQNGSGPRSFEMWTQSFLAWPRRDGVDLGRYQSRSSVRSGLMPTTDGKPQTSHGVQPQMLPVAFGTSHLLSVFAVPEKGRA